MSPDNIMLAQKNLRTVSDLALKLISELMGSNTLFVAINDGETNFIVKAINRGDNLVKEGSALPLFESYCSVVTQSQDPGVIIQDTTSFELTKFMPITEEIGRTSFIGVPIELPGKGVIGTICGLDNKGYVYSSRDIEILKMVAKLFSYVLSLEQLAFRDSLTGALTRDFLAIALDGGWQERFESLAFFYIDLDDFKEVNDNFGHSVGDEVLRIIVERIESNTRQSDWVARLGGDEFLVVIPNYESKEALMRIVAKVASEISAEIKIGESIISMAASIGISSYPDNGSTLDKLVELADDAMYEAKGSGKHTFRFA